MKNITAFAVFVIICLHTVPAQAQSSYAFSITPQFGMLYGQAEEIVYKSPTDKLSQLLWDMKPVLYYGGTLDFSRREPLTRWGFFANVSLKAGIPAEIGIMEDRDWMSQDNKVTFFSSHTNRLNNLLWFDGTVGFSFPIRSRFLLRAYASVPYMYIHYSGFDGSGKYAREKQGTDGTYYDIDDDPRLVDFDGKVINYTQEWLVITPGVSFGVSLGNAFFLDASFQISPLVICADLDEHLTTNVQYKDYMVRGWYLEPGIVLSYAINKRFTLSLDCSWRYASETRGKTYLRQGDFGPWIQQGEAGAGMSVIDAGLLFSVRL